MGGFSEFSLFPREVRIPLFDKAQTIEGKRLPSNIISDPGHTDVTALLKERGIIGVPRDTVELLERMLTYDPLQRITLEELCEYFEIDTDKDYSVPVVPRGSWVEGTKISLNAYYHLQDFIIEKCTSLPSIPEGFPPVVAILTFDVMNRYLTLEAVKTVKSLILVGIACLDIAARLYSSDNAYYLAQLFKGLKDVTTLDVIAKEAEILRTLDFVIQNCGYEEWQVYLEGKNVKEIYDRLRKLKISPDAGYDDMIVALS